MALTLASFTKAAKKCAFDSSLSEEAFLNAILEPYVEAGHVKQRGGKPFSLDKSRTSKVLNGRCDVPLELRKALVRYGIEKATANGFEAIFEDCLDVSLFDDLSEEIVGLIDAEDIMGEKLKRSLTSTIKDPQLFMARALMGAIRADNKAVASSRLWTNGKASVYLEIGDLFAHGFGRTRKSKEIVVIPVNTTFDTKVTRAYENDPKPLVSDRTIHGQWLIRMQESGVTPDELDVRIGQSIQAQIIEPVAKHGLGTSPKPEYPFGTVAVIENNRAVFYLLAISRFDENNNARSSEALLTEAVEKLLAFYDERGQGLDLCLPLMGTGMSRTTVLPGDADEHSELMNHQQSYDLITSIISKRSSLIHGKMTIVVYKNDRDKLNLPLATH